MTVAARSAQEYDLLGGGSDLLDFGLLAARAAAGCRRVLSGSGLDEVDGSALGQLAAHLTSAAETLEFFETHGKHGVPPTRAHAASVDVAIEAIMPEVPASRDSEHLAAELRRMADRIVLFVRAPSPDTAQTLTAFCSGLSTTVLRETGQPGEFTSTL